MSDWRYLGVGRGRSRARIFSYSPPLVGASFSRVPLDLLLCVPFPKNLLPHVPLREERFTIFRPGSQGPGRRVAGSPLRSDAGVIASGSP
jgi:hypothetical protein